MTKGEWVAVCGEALYAKGIAHFHPLEIADVGREAFAISDRTHKPRWKVALKAPSLELIPNALMLCELLCELREADPFGPVLVNSWYRDRLYNYSIGGVAKWLHGLRLTPNLETLAWGATRRLHISTYAASSAGCRQPAGGLVNNGLRLSLVPSWFWIVLPLVGMLAVGIRGATQASYYRGIADDAESRLEEQRAVLDSVVWRADSLTKALEAADSVVAVQRREAEEEVARLVLSREQARERSEATVASLRISLDARQVIELDQVVESYEIQIASLEEVIGVERSLTAAERMRATQSSELVLSLRSVIAEQEERSSIMTIEIEALRSSIQPSLGLRIKADWWLAAVGFAAGALITE